MLSLAMPPRQFALYQPGLFSVNGLFGSWMGQSAELPVFLA